MTKRFTGWHMTAILVGGFSVVLAVNLFMASRAVGSFGGVVVENSYVASQQFNTWLNQAEKQNALGWSARVTRAGDGRLDVATSGTPQGTFAQAELRHPLGKRDVLEWTLIDAGNGRFTSVDAVPEGRWLVRVTLEHAGRTMRLERPLG